jgi:peroxin-13
MYGGGSMYGTPAMSPYGNSGVYSGPTGAPPGLPPPHTGHRSKWQVFMDMTHNLMHFFGRVSFLMDENAHAVHFFITALLQLLDRASFLWGEVARFVLRILGYKRPVAKADQLAQAKSDSKGSGHAPFLGPSRMPSCQALPAISPSMEAAWPS